MDAGAEPWHAPAPPLPSLEPRPQGAPPARAQLAAALLSHDLSLEPLDPSLPVHSSAVLQPFRHLLAAQPARVTAAHSTTDSFELVDAPDEGDVLHSGNGYTADGDAGAPHVRRRSLASSAGWSATGRGRPAQPLELDPDEEERLASEWGLDEVMSSIASNDGARSPRRATPLGSDMTGVGLVRVPGAVAMSDAGRLDDAEDEAVEVLETRSMPDLDRPRVLSYAESILDGLEQRLASAPTVDSAQPFGGDDADSDWSGEGPRIKIIERTPTQRRRERGHRLRAHSLGPSSALSPLPSLAELSGDGSVGDLGCVSSGSRAGLATRDSLFLGPAAPGMARRGSAVSRGFSVALPSRRASNDLDRAVSSRPDSRLSLGLGGIFAPARSDDSNIPADADAPPRHSSSSFERPSTPGFTSRFDPLVIAVQRAELVKDRPAFANPEAGKPPKVVLLPAPLAGRSPSPPRLERVEGPDPEEEKSASDGKTAHGGEEEPLEDAPGLREPLRPAGALYGRSLMDVMAERSAQLKAQQRAYVPGSDDRRRMFEQVGPPTAQGALAPAEGGAAEVAATGYEDDVPLPLMPAGGRGRELRGGKSPERLRAAKKAHTSIFGPDLVYQRELARAKELEQLERVEKEAAEREQREREERRRHKKLVKGAKRRSQLALDEASAREWQPPAEEMRKWEASEPIETIEEPVELHRCDSQLGPRRNSLAPSLSMPLGLGAGLTSSASGGDWFAGPVEPNSGTVAADEDDEEEGYQPRPISSVSGYRTVGAERLAARRRTMFGSSDSGSDDESTSVLARSTVPPAGRHLPFPGESSSHGHDSRSLAETEDILPLGVQYARQDFGLHPTVAGDGEDDEDERPLAQRFLRSPLLTSVRAPTLQLDFDVSSSGFGQLPVRGNEPSEEDHDEDDKPLGARFSTIQPADEDDVPLAIHRLSLAPRRFEPSATLRVLDDDGKTVSDESDDLPLGLKAASGGVQQWPPFPFHPAHPSLAPGFPPTGPAMPYNYSQFTLGPEPHIYGAVPPDPHMQLALAQMQMQVAMQQQVAGEPVAAGTGGMIERWRREVSGRNGVNA